MSVVYRMSYLLLVFPLHRLIAASLLPSLVDDNDQHWEKNYSIEALRKLYQHHYQLPPCQATQLIYSRFINIHGLPSRNIPANLHMENLNAVGNDASRAWERTRLKRLLNAQRKL